MNTYVFLKEDLSIIHILHGNNKEELKNKYLELQREDYHCYSWLEFCNIYNSEDNIIINRDINFENNKIKVLNVEGVIDGVPVNGFQFYVNEDRKLMFIYKKVNRNNNIRNIFRNIQNELSGINDNA